MTRPLVVDGQVFQTSAYGRGMGKYSLSLLRALREAGADLHLVLSRALPHEDALLKTLTQALPGVDVALLELRRARLGGGATARANRAVLDAHVGGLGEVSFLSLDVLLGETTAVLTSVAGVSNLLLVHDLIPLLRPDLSLRHGDAAAIYLSRLGELLRADRVLTISATVAADLTELLGIDPARVTVIGSSPVDHGGAGGSSADLPAGVTEPYVLMPTAADARKNNRRAIMGFEHFRRRHEAPHQLVLTSGFPARQRAALAGLSEAAVLAGPLPGPVLEALYARAVAVLVPSEAEGLGLPLLEAVRHGKPVACSDIAAFREVSVSAFAFFDPTSVVDIARGLGQAVASPAVDEVEYARVLATWTWARSATALIEAVRSTSSEPARPRPRVLVVGARPDGTGPSGPALQRAHTALARTADVDYLLSADPSRAPGPDRVDHLSHVAPVQRIGPGLEVDPEAYDSVVVHLDDDPDCAGALLLALAVPATVVLYAPSLRRTWTAAREQGLVSDSRLALERELGDDGLASVRAVAREVVTVADRTAAG